MTGSLEGLKNYLAMELYGMTPAEAHEKGICLGCKEVPVHPTEVDEAEYKISALCSKCYEEAVSKAV